MKRFIWFIALLVLGVLAGVGSFAYYPANNIQAGQDVDLKIKIEISVDNGTTWHNYSGDSNPEGESVTAEPGDEVLVRIKTWNLSDTHYADDVEIAGIFSNAEYIVEAETTDTDEDNNGNVYTGDLVDLGVGLGNIDVAGSGSEIAGYESVIIKTKLASDFPEGRTIITGTVTITDEGTDTVIVVFSDPFAKYALADGLAQSSTARVIVNVAEEEPEVLPETGFNK